MSEITTSELTIREKRQWLMQLQHAMKNKQDNSFPMSDIQESFLVGKFLAKNQDRVGCHLYFEFEEASLDADRLYIAWCKLVSSHEQLHTVLRKDKMQELLMNYEVPKFPIHDVTKQVCSKIEEHRTEIRRQMSHEFYEIGQWPLFNICISKMPNNTDIIHFSIDEGIIDGHSLFIILNQWHKLYQNPDWNIPVYDFTFRDYVERSRVYKNERKFQRDLDYFMDKYKDLPSGPSLPYVKNPKRKEGQDYFERKRFEATIEPKYWDSIKNLANELGVSETSLLMTCFGEVLYRFSKSDHFSILNTFFNRPPMHKDIEKIVGPFVTTNIVHIKKESEMKLGDQIKMCQKELWDDMDHTGVSGIEALREMRVRDKKAPNLSIPIVFTSMLNRAGKEADGSWLEKSVYGISQTPQVCLDHQVYHFRGGVQILWDAIPEYFDTGTLERMFEDYQYCLRTVALTGELPESKYSAERSSEADLRQVNVMKLTEMQQSYQYNKIANAKSGHIYQEFDIKHINEKALNSAWNRLVDIHGMLRVRMDRANSQYIEKQVSKYKFKIFDLRMETDDKRRLDEIRTHQMNTQLPDTFGNRYAVALSLLPENKGRLHISIDMAIADGRSINMLYNQLFQLYGTSSIKEGSRVSYFDYVAYLQTIRQSTESKPMGAYWKNKIKSLPSGPSFPHQDTGIEKGHERIFGQLTNWKEYKERLERHNLDLDAVLFTAYTKVLNTWTECGQYTVVYVNWNRPNIGIDLNGIIGEFTTLGWIPVDTHQNSDSFISLVKEYKDIIEKDFQNSPVGGMSELRKRLMANEINLPVVYTNCLWMEEGELDSNIKLGYGYTSTPGVILDCMSKEKDAELSLFWDYDRSAIDKRTAESMMESYVKTLNEFFDEIEVSNHCIHKKFEKMAAEYSERIAVTFEGREVTYKELNDRANQAARYLMKQGVVKGKLIALYMQRSEQLIIMILAILKTGSAYVPIEPSYPLQRVKTILEDSNSVMLITDRSLLSGLETFIHEKILILEEMGFLSAYESEDNLNVDSAASDVAYVIYTSGSTGTPKGVLIPHSNVMRLFSSTAPWFGFNESDVWTMFHSCAFDFSVWEIWGALLHGGRLVVVSYETSRSTRKFYNLVVNEKVTVLNQTPTAFYKFQDTDVKQGQQTALRYIIFGGETLNPQKLKRWFEQHEEGVTKLINMYGITETTVHVTYKEIKKEDTARKNSNIGISIPDLEIYLLDDALNPVEDGTEGEMYVSGSGLAIGYLSRPELTQEKFIPNPFHFGGRLYRTGDVARKLPNGDLEYMGRCDLQVQIRGFRVELGDIEAALLSHPDVKEAVVIIKDGETDDPKIAGYVIAENDKELTAKELRHFVRDILPDYMVPNRLEFVDSYPMNENGKLDRNALLNGTEPEAAPVVEAPVVEEIHERAGTLDLEAEIIKLFEEELESENQIVASDDIFDIGATSITIMTVSQKVTDKYGVEISIDTFLERSVISQIAEDLSGLLHLNNEPKPNEGMEEEEDSPVEQILFTDFSRFLSLLRMKKVRGETKYLYPSSGGRNAVQTYVYIKENAVETLEQGLYYYHPLKNELQQVNQTVHNLRESMSEYGRAEYNRSGFVIFFIAELNALIPVYMDYSRILCKIDAGYMSQILMEREKESQLCIRTLPVLDFNRIAESFHLGKNQLFIHALAGGAARGDSKDYGQVKEMLVREQFNLYQHFLEPAVYDTASEINRIQRSREFNILSKRELVTLTISQPHIRKDLEESSCTALYEFEYEDKEYKLRSSQRNFKEQKVSNQQFTRFLSLFSYKSMLAVSPCYLPTLSIYVAVKEDGVESVESGVYKYNRTENTLDLVSSGLSQPMHKCHTPFNIAIAKQAKFFIFFITEEISKVPWIKNGLYHYAAVESGMYGQMLMYHQSEMDMGLVPIGGMDFDRIRDDFKLREEQICIHSLMCGMVEFEDGTDIKALSNTKKEELYPLSYGQQALYYEYRMNPLSSSYNTAYHVRMHNVIQPEVMKAVLQLLMKKYVLLRARFYLKDGVPCQSIDSSCSPKFSLYDVSGMEEEEIYALNQTEYHKPFDLSAGEVYRFTVFKKASDDFIIMFNIHHIVTDYISTGILVGDFWSFYEQILQGSTKEIKVEPDYRYMDFIEWQRDYVNSKEGENSLSYWKSVINQVSAGSLFSDYKADTGVCKLNGSIHFTLPEPLVERYREFSRNTKKTLNAIYLAAYKLLLGIYFGKKEISVGTMANARGRKEFNEVAGYFINPLVINTRLEESLSFLQLTESVNKEIFNSLKHQDYPYSVLVSKIGEDLKAVDAGLFQVTFQLIALTGKKPHETQGLTDYTIPQQEGQFDLELELIDRGEQRITGRIAYNRNMFGEEKIWRFYKHYIQLLNEILVNPDKPLSEFEVVDEEERHLLLDNYGRSEKMDYDPVCIHELVEKQSALNPNYIAVVAHLHKERISITYDDLNRRANQLAGYLHQEVTSESSVVGICLKKSVELLVSVLAVYKAGLTYVPIDPDYPQERYRFIVKDTSMVALICSTAQETNRFAAVGNEIAVDMDVLSDTLMKYKDENLALSVLDSQTAYIIYTSGSTGEPKGVCIPHKGAVNTFYGYQRAYELDRRNHIHCQMSNFTFDVFVGDFIRSLCCGGTLVLCPKEILTDAKNLYQFIVKEKISFAEFVPAVIRNLVQYLEQNKLKIDCMDSLVVSSDSWTMSDLKKFYKHFHENTKFISAYGVTEVSIDNTFMNCKEIPSDFSGFVPIGRPLANVKTYIVGNNMKLVPIGVAGELCIGGPGVAYGYLNRPELNMDKFIPDPFAKDGTKLYRTGDLVKYHPNKMIEFLGRIDNQVKIRGLRIEIGEIEAVLSSYKGIKDSCVITKKDKFGENYLVGYYTCTQKIMLGELKEYYRQKLPEYMIPSIFIKMDEFPLNSNGKVDRKALPEANLQDNTEFLPPVTKLQKKLAEVWKSVLALEKVGINDDFFQIGGHSFITFKLLEEIEVKLGYHILLSDFLKHSTILDMEKMLAHGEVSSAEEGKDEISEISSYLHTPQNILLTGSTGFLGCHLLADLLRAYDGATIHCLIRERGSKNASDRLKDSILLYELSDRIDLSRIKIIDGDLEKPRFGLEESKYHVLEQGIDTIFHCGAFVNFAYPIEILKKANVGGTEEILRLAASKRLKLVHYISTTSVYDNISPDNTIKKVKMVVEEDAPLVENDKLNSILGYSQSKWHAEQLIQKARKKGVLVNIYRPNIISGNSRTGIWNKADLAYKILSSAVLTKTVPKNEFLFNWVPVDYVSEAIVTLSKHGECINGNFNLSAPQDFDFKSLYKKLTEYGLPMEQFNMDDWVAALEGYIAKDKSFSWLFEVTEFMKWEGINSRLCYDISNTLDGLDGSGVACPVIDEAIIRNYCKFILS